MPLLNKHKKIDLHKKVSPVPFFEEAICRGTPYDMGVQQGQRFQHKIKRNERILSETELFRKFVPGFIPLPFLLATAKKIIPVFIPSIFSNDESTYSRLTGIADGAGIDRELIFLTQALEIILDHIPYNVGCTTIAITPERSSLKEPVILRNFDFLDNFRVFNTIRRSYPDKKIPSVELSFTSIAGAHTGMNEAGLTFSYNYGYSREPLQVGIPLTCHIQTALESFERTDQAVNFLINKPFPAGAIITVCDASGNMVTIEGSPSKKSLRFPDKNGLIVNTNCYMTEEMRDVNIPSGALFDKNMPFGLEKVRVHESNEKRSASINELIGNGGKIPVDTLFQLLSLHNDDNNERDNCVCRHLSIFHTIASAIMLPRSRVAYFLIGSPCRKKYHKYTF